MIQPQVVLQPGGEMVSFFQEAAGMKTEEFGPFLAEQRKKRNITQSQLAEKLHVSTAAVSKWERCRCLPEISKLEDIADLLGVAISAFAGIRMSSCGRNLHGVIACFAVYAAWEVLSNLRTNDFLEIIVLSAGTIAVGEALGFLMGMLASKVRKS